MNIILHVNHHEPYWQVYATENGPELHISAKTWQDLTTQQSCEYKTDDDEDDEFDPL